MKKIRYINKTLLILLVICQGLMFFAGNNVWAAAPTMTPSGGSSQSNAIALTSGTQGSSYSDTITAGGSCGSGSYTWSQPNGTLPPGLTTSTSGTNNSIFTISGTPTTTGTYRMKFQVERSGCSSTKSGWYKITINSPPTLTITTTSLPDGIVGTAYTTTSITATGGSGSYTWSISSGSLPAGLSLGASGTPSTTISGTPTTANTYTFTVRVTDSLSNTDDQDFTVDIASVIQITTTSPLTDGTEGTAYSATITGSGSGTYVWSVSDGLPPGLTLASSGTPRI